MIYLYIGLGVIATGVIGFYAVLCYKFLKLTLIPKKESNWDFMLDQIKRKGYKWAYLDMEYETVKIKSQYGYDLYGYLFYAKEPSHKWVIDCHGWTSKGIGQFKYVDIFRELQYNVLIVNHRYSTESGGRCISFSQFEKYDVISWIDYIKAQDNQATFGIFGESMGATTAIYVASLDNRIKFLISYCAYASITKIFSEVLEQRMQGKKKKLMPLLLSALVPYKVIARLLYGVKVSEIDSREAMKKVSVPTLIMHSKADTLINIANAYDLLAINADAELIEFENSPHAVSYSIYPEKFTLGIQQFIKKVEKEKQI